MNALLVLVVLAGVRAWQHRDAPGSGPAPALTGILLDGTSFDLGAPPARPVLVHFWASWCAICRAEQASIAAIAAERPVITVAMQSGDDHQLRQYLGKAAQGFPVLNDPAGAIAKRWGVGSVPASFIIDTQGNVRFVEFGYTTEWGLRLRLWWASF